MNRTTFTPNLRIEQGVRPVTLQDLREMRNLWSTSLSEIRNRAQGAVGIALARMEEDPEFQDLEKNAESMGLKAYVDTWFTQTSQGQSPSPYGIHVDGAYKNSTPGPGLNRDISRLGHNHPARMFLIAMGTDNGDASPLFVTEEFSVDPAGLTPENAFHEVHAQAMPKILDGSLNYVRLPNNALAVYDGNTLHTAMPTRINSGFSYPRGLVRVSFLPHVYNYAHRESRHSDVKVHYPEI